eukprot:COSAG05_NODE_19598_length_290_cov_0.816754_1_plen_57_part_01
MEVAKVLREETPDLTAAGRLMAAQQRLAWGSAMSRRLGQGCSPSHQLPYELCALVAM